MLFLKNRVQVSNKQDQAATLMPLFIENLDVHFIDFLHSEGIVVYFSYSHLATTLKLKVCLNFIFNTTSTVNKQLIIE